MLTPSDLNALQNDIAQAQKWVDRSTIAVFVGLLGEIFVMLFFMFFGDEKKKRTELICSLVFTGVIAVGVFGESMFGARAERKNTQIQIIFSADAARLEDEAGQANDRAAAAVERAAKADERASKNEREAEQLRKAAEDERFARVHLESKVAWRSIPLEKQTDLASRLNKFSGEPALVIYSPNDAEEGSFATDITTTLRKAQWDVFEPMAVMSMREGPLPFGTNPPLPTGVLIWSTNDEISRSAAQTLVNELSFCGFDASLSADVSSVLGIHPTPTRVVVSIEHKPEGPQGEYKSRRY